MDPANLEAFPAPSESVQVGRAILLCSRERSLDFTEPLSNSSHKSVQCH